MVRDPGDSFSSGKDGDFECDGSSILFRGKTVVALDGLKLRGMHNMENIMAALAILCAEQGEQTLFTGETRQALRAFSPDVHRMELFAEADGIRFFDDSKATNPHSVNAFLNTYGGSKNVVLILGMFPGIMAVTAIYFILKALGLSSGTMTTVALILVYSAGSGAGFYVMKGYMDTIPTSLDEAALLDGCTRFQVFHKIIIPICKPMIVYQAIIGFLTPWLDFVMAKVICRTQSNYTVALGLWLMLQKEYIQNWFARFAAAAVVISVPIAILFIVMQRFYQESMSGSVKG